MPTTPTLRTLFSGRLFLSALVITLSLMTLASCLGGCATAHFRDNDTSTTTTTPAYTEKITVAKPDGTTETHTINHPTVIQKTDTKGKDIGGLYVSKDMPDFIASTAQYVGTNWLPLLGGVFGGGSVVGIGAKLITSALNRTWDDGHTTGLLKTVGAAAQAGVSANAKPS